MGRTTRVSVYCWRPRRLGGRWWWLVRAELTYAEWLDVHTDEGGSFEEHRVLIRVEVPGRGFTWERPPHRQTLVEETFHLREDAP